MGNVYRFIEPVLLLMLHEKNIRTDMSYPRALVSTP